MPVFTWFGGKRKIAPLVWRAFGDVKHYVEPFCGSAAVLFARPDPWIGSETINDSDGMVANFFRAVRREPDAVARFLGPMTEVDYSAAARVVRAEADGLTERMRACPDYYDARMAGLWLYANQMKLGSKLELNEKPKSHCPWWLRANGCDVLGNVCARLERVRVLCGDWRRTVSGHTELGCGKPCGVFMDPPYDVGCDRRMYREYESVSGAVCEWALEHGDDRRLKIALCGYANEHTMPESWQCVQWKRNGGFENQGKNKAVRLKECVWFSPGCNRVDGVLA